MGVTMPGRAERARIARSTQLGERVIQVWFVVRWRRHVYDAMHPVDVGSLERDQLAQDDGHVVDERREAHAPVVYVRRCARWQQRRGDRERCRFGQVDAVTRVEHGHAHDERARVRHVQHRPLG